MTSARDLNIDEEFRNKIPPLTVDEFDRLEESILSEKEIREPIIAWDGTIVDGHNRFAIWKAHMEEIPEPKVREMQFADRWEAIDWMIANQLGRRNVTDEQRTYLIGKLYEARKHCPGASDGFRGNQHGNVVSRQNGNLPKSGKTAETIAKEFNIGYGSVTRAEQFSQGLDVAENVLPGFKDDVLSGKTKVTKQSIAELRKLPEEEVKAKVEEIKNPKPKAEHKPRQKREDVLDASKFEEMYGVLKETDVDKQDELESVIAEIEMQEDYYIGNLRNCLSRNIKLKERDDYNDKVMAFLDGIVADIESIKREFIN